MLNFRHQSFILLFLKGVLLVSSSENCQINIKPDNSRNGSIIEVQRLTSHNNRECKITFTNNPGWSLIITIHNFTNNEFHRCQTYISYIAIPAGSDLFPHIIQKHCEKPPIPLVTSLSGFALTLKADPDKNVSLKFTYHYTDARTYSHLVHDGSCGDQTRTQNVGEINLEDSGKKIECNWLIEAPKDHQILLRITELMAGSTESCIGEERLDVYDGFVDPTMIPERRYCAELKYYPIIDRQFMSTSNMLGVRLVSPASQIKLLSLEWNFIRKYSENTETPCTEIEHYCSGGRFCLDKQRTVCTDYPSFCIDKKLMCDGKQSCGLIDDSDENRCGLVKKIISIVLPSLAGLTILIIIIACYIKRRITESTRAKELARERLLNRRRRRAWVPGGDVPSDKRASTSKKHRKISLNPSMLQSTQRKMSTPSHSYDEISNKNISLLIKSQRYYGNSVPETS